MTALAAFHVVVGTVLLAVGIHALINHRAFRRLRQMPRSSASPYVSVLIPARNEAKRIEACVRGWASQDYPAYEVLVYDDESTDHTAMRARAAAGAFRIRVIPGDPLPPGWRGKPWACHRLRALARGELLVFADADVMPASETLARAAGAMAALGVDALSAVPSHTSPSLSVRALVAVQNWAALAFVPSWLAPSPRRRMFAAVTGQFLVIRPRVYDASRGFAAVRLALAEDVALGRRLIALGYRVRLLDGAGLLTCRPYDTVRQVWQATARNLLPVFFNSPALLLIALAGLAAIYLGPIAVLVVGLASGHAGGMLWTWVPLAEVGVGLATRLIADRRAGYSPWLAAVHPLVVGALLGMGVASVARFRFSGAVDWRDRHYDVADAPLSDTRS